MTGIWTALAFAVPAVLVARCYRDSAPARSCGPAARTSWRRARSGSMSLRRRLGAWTISAVICARVGRAARAFPRRLLALEVLFRRHTGPAHHAHRRRHDYGVRRVLRRGAGHAHRRDPAPRSKAASTSSAWPCRRLFGLTQAGLCVLILLVMYRRPGGTARATGARRAIGVRREPRRHAARRREADRRSACAAARSRSKAWSRTSPGSARSTTSS